MTKLTMIVKKGESTKELIKALGEYAHSRDELEFILTMQPRKATRSLQQNAFLHGVLIPAFCRAIGDNDKEYIKHLLKQKYLAAYSEKGMPYVRDTHTLNVKEMMEFIENCMIFLPEVGGSLDAQEYKQYVDIK